jgi:hypothetical protein
MTESSATATPARFRYFNQHWTWWFMVAVLVLIAMVRLCLLNFPLERDEGEYAYAGQLMLQGIPPYKLAFNMKFPGTYAMYALILFLFRGDIHWKLALVMAACNVLGAQVGSRLAIARGDKLVRVVVLVVVFALIVKMGISLLG